MFWICVDQNNYACSVKTQSRDNHLTWKLRQELTQHVINAANVCKCTRGSASLILTVDRARAPDLDPRCKSRGGVAVCVAPATGDDAPVAAAAALDDSLCSGVVVAVPAAPAVSALVGRAPESSPWFVRRRGVIIDVPAEPSPGRVPSSRCPTTARRGTRR